MLTTRAILNDLAHENNIKLEFASHADAESSLAIIRQCRKCFFLNASSNHVQDIASGAGSAIAGLYLFIKLNNLFFRANPACGTVNQFFLLASSSLISWSFSSGVQYAIAECSLFRTKDAYMIDKLNALEDEVLQKMSYFQKTENLLKLNNALRNT